MIIFEEPSTAPIVGLVFAVVFFVIQLLLCFKAENPIIQRLPLYLILLCVGFILLICTGIFGTGSGFLGNIHLIVAMILGTVVGIAAVGVASAWMLYKIYQKIKANEAPIQKGREKEEIL